MCENNTVDNIKNAIFAGTVSGMFGNTVFSYENGITRGNTGNSTFEFSFGKKIILNGLPKDPVFSKILNIFQNYIDGLPVIIHNYGAKDYLLFSWEI